MARKELKLRLRVLLAERDWEQKDLVERTNLTNRAVSEMVNGKQKSYPKASLNELINAFEITDMNELFKIVEVEDNEETDN
ncbi:MULTISPECIES: helix-turn-helix transcriptional regulator [Lysinibacillus]|uniref:helix-turn-helix domain-containing protein n=1 Tax=Lysinibacillus TaxID=400634 RepID=UPI00214AD102|nr:MULTISPECIES: helix-turn-helix transcriptional regulator [Lysinibacillus]UUV24954.1 helix-turn-helix transcriptional regulator [Lysinibacillus sp. FN11]UYB47824.1 helix-turn-helix transcriptional regulator [Lysinibacillus capsici]